MKQKLLMMLALSTLLGGYALEEDASKKDLEKLQGDWAQVSMVVDGEKLPDDEAQALFRSIKGEQYTVFRFKKALGKGSFKIDATNKPRTIDALPVIAGQKLKPMLGIYECDGAKLKLCFARAGQPRPADFSAEKGSGQTLSVWEREKK